MYKRRNLKRKAAPRRRRRTAVPRAPRTGGFTIKRAVTPLYLTNDASVGQYLVTPKTGILNVGNPEPHPIFAGVYKVPFAFEFSLADLTQYAELTGICDRYKITSVRVKCQYNASSTEGIVAGGIPNTVPILHYVTDVDDATPSTSGQVDAKMGVKIKALNNGRFVNMSCRPRPSLVVNDNSQTANGYAIPSKPQWINAGYPLVPHYGIKGYIENLCLQPTTLATSCLTWELSYTVQVRDLQ